MILAAAVDVGFAALLFCQPLDIKSRPSVDTCRVAVAAVFVVQFIVTTSQTEKPFPTGQFSLIHSQFASKDSLE
jgi:hypothetical protein